MEKHNTINTTNKNLSNDTNEINSTKQKINSTTNSINTDSNKLITQIFDEFNIVVIRPKYDDEYWKKYREINKEILTKRRQSYYLANKEKIRKKQKEYYINNINKFNKKYKKVKQNE